ncbi:MAG: BREX-1 system adenine-specific DNA-methyltransferase PglX [Bacteroidota bacterium]
MDKGQSNLLRNTVTRCRQLLEASIFDVLEGQFGIHRDGTIEDEARMGHLSPEDRSYRHEVISSLEHKRAAGFDSGSAVAELVREAAFTHLNRLCAFKMLEERKVIREAVGRGPNSNGFKFYLAGSPEDERNWLEGREDVAYRHFLRWLSGTLEGEVGALFSRNDPANRLFPPHRVLLEVLELLNDPKLAGIWAEDETIGWVYQYFTPKELREKARKESQAPRNSYELAFRNQFYTPRYVVRFLVDNTLGRIWYEMRGGRTKLAEICSYLVRPSSDACPAGCEKNPRRKKDPRDIRIIDPACGSGHFLLYCFDLLEVIYAEAYEDDEAPAFSATGRTLRQDYPDPHEFKRFVPALILEHNLHGIDIDLRSVQITALALWMRAQRAYQEMGLPKDERPSIKRSNIVRAEPMPGEEDLLEEFVADLEPKLLGQLVEQVFGKMKLAGEAGSLLKIEEEIKDAISEAKRQWVSRPRMEQLSLFPEERRREIKEDERFDVSSVTDDSFWEDAEERLVEALRAYAERAANGKAFARRLFADDAERGFAFVDISRKKFDVVLMNPPFGESAKGAKGYIADHFPHSGHDLACAFVERWLAKCEPGGTLGAITTRTPFFLSSSTEWRQHVILKEGALEVFADLGYGVLDAMVETAAYTLSNGGSGGLATFIRALRDEDKAAALLEAAENPGDSRRFTVSPASFSQVPGSPLCYWVSDRIRRLFVELPPFEGEGRTVKQGLATADDFRFVRAWWEVPRESEARSREETMARKRWVPFAKGGAYSPYYADVHLVVNWERDGEEIKRRINPDSGKPYSNVWQLKQTERDFFFRPGLTWPLRARAFCPQVLPSGVIFSVRGYAAFAPRETLPALLGLGESKVFDYLFKVLLGRFGFPEFIVGVLQQLPVPGGRPELSDRLARAALDCYHDRRMLCSNDETNRQFSLPPLVMAQGDSLIDRLANWGASRRHIEDHYLRRQAEVDEMAFELYGIKDEERDAIVAELGRPFGPAEVDEDQDWNEDKDSEFLESDNCAQVRALLSWCVGVAFGRFDVRLATGERSIPQLGDPFDPLPIHSPGMLSEDPPPQGYPIAVDGDGILVDDEFSDDDIVRKVREVLHFLWKDRAEAIEREACDILGVRDLRDYFRRPGKGGFFEDHIKRYSKSRRKAPIYWLLQSARRNYAVWLYYHRLDRDILFKAVEHYVRPRIQLQENLVAELRKGRDGVGTGAERRRFGREVEKQESLLAELIDFREKLERTARFYVEPDRFDPDLNDGVVLNIAPLWELVPWAEAKRYWDELSSGKYEWSSISKQFKRREEGGSGHGRG